MGVGRNYRTLPATILTYFSRFVHIHTSDHTRTPVASTTQLTFLKNLTNKVNVCPSRASLPSVATHCVLRFKSVLSTSRHIFTYLILVHYCRTVEQRLLLTQRSDGVGNFRLIHKYLLIINPGFFTMFSSKDVSDIQDYHKNYILTS